MPRPRSLRSLLRLEFVAERPRLPCEVGGWFWPLYTQPAVFLRIARRFASVGPVATIVLGYLVLGESFGAWQSLGTILVLLGVLRASVARPAAVVPRP